MNLRQSVLTAALLLMGGSTILAVDNHVDRDVRPTPKALAKNMDYPEWAPGRLLSSGPSAMQQLTSGFSPYALTDLRRVSPSGATISGLKVGATTAADYKLGWYEINTSNGNQTMLWSSDLTNKVGYVRNGIFYGFYFMEFWGSYYANWAAYDVATGAYLNDLKGSYTPYDQSWQVITATYNPDEDRAYIYTFNADQTGMMFRQVNPITMEWEDINDNVDVEKAAFVWAYYPKDGRIYGLNHSGQLGKVNLNTGEIDEIVGSTSLAISTNLQAMVYSPIEHKFMAELILSNGLSLFTAIDPETAQASGITFNDNVAQYAVLMCEDEDHEDAAPGVPSFDSLTFDKASLSGVGKATLSAKAFSGADMTGTVNYTVNIDDQEAASGSGNPGQQVSFNLTTTEGLHDFTFIPWVKSGNEVLEGPSKTVTKYVGNDTPDAPANVTYNGTLVKWDAVTTGANDGYIDASKVTYNVYINGTRQNSSPVSDTELTVTMPEGSYAFYTATVEAICNGKTSTKGSSDATILGNAFNLPFSFTPTEDEISLCTMVSGTDGATYWAQGNDYNYNNQVVFKHTTNSSVASDDWLFLPNCIFDDAKATYEISIEMRAGLSSFPEKLEVAIGDSPKASAMKTIASETLTNYEYKTYTYYFEVDGTGEKNIGLHCTSAANMFYLFVHNISVKQSSKSMNCPAEVQSLTATAGKKGALNATVEFKMPVKSLGGESLFTFDGNETLTATISSGSETLTVTGAPGSRQSVNIATAQGDNTITVFATNAYGDGAESSVSIYTGIAQPVAVPVTATCSDDNRSLTISWTAPTAGVNGGYIDPTGLTYKIWIATSTSWLALDEVGADQTSYTYTLPAGSPLEFVKLGMTVSNVAGSSESLAFASGVIGTPYTLPMVENFPGELTYEPIVAQALDENYAGAWQFSDPALIDGNAVNSSGTALIGYTNSVNSYARTSLPKFSTIGLDKADVTLEFYIDSFMPDVDVLICGNSDDETVIGQVTNAGDKGWRQFTFSLPESFMNRQWCYVALVAKFGNDIDTYAMLDAYTVKQTVAKDLAMNQLSGYSDVTIDLDYKYTATLRNLGYEDVTLPEVKATFYSETGGKFSLPVNLSVAPGSIITSNQEVTATFEFTPNVEMVGEGVLTVGFDIDDLNADNNSISRDIVVKRSSEPLVTTLTAIYNADNGTVQLEWDEPALSLETETAEDLDASSYASELGVWKNVDLDKEITYGTSSFSMTGMYAPKAWQVFSISTNADAGSDFQPYNGDQMLMAWSPEADVAADDWLISPEVQGGSMVTFYMNILNAKYSPETVEVCASSTGNSPDDFTKVASFSKNKRGWELCSVELPKDAKYFALHYVSQQKFAAMVDDITYAPVSMGLSVEGYNIYDRGAKIASNVTDCNYSISGIEPDSYHAYNVTTLVKLASGNVIEYGFSNTAVIGGAGINEIPVEATGTERIYDLQGRRVNAANRPSGIYLIGGKKARVK